MAGHRGALRSATDSSSPASQNVTISSNKCQRVDNQFLIAEGLNSSAGDGSGKGISSHITFINNLCDVGVSQALEIGDVQHVRVAGNTITGKPDKAFSFQNKSTNAVVTANKSLPASVTRSGWTAPRRPATPPPAVGGGP